MSKKPLATPFDGLLGLVPGRLPQTTASRLVVAGLVVGTARVLPALAARLVGEPEEDADDPDQALADRLAAQAKRAELRRDLQRVRAADKYQRVRQNPVAMAKRRAWEEAHREERRAYMKRWKAANAERDRELKNNWARRNYHANPEAERAKSRAWYAAHREQVLERARQNKAAKRAQARQQTTDTTPKGQTT